MISEKKHIIAITRDKILAVEVLVEKKPKFAQTREYGWEPETIDLAFGEIIKHFQTKKFRILVADSLGYVLRLTIPADITSDKERGFIGEKIREKIPEDFEGGEWDYRRITTGAEREVIVFALVKDFYKQLTKAIRTSGLEAEAIEIEAVAKTRDANPVIGIALKEDIQGRDEEVLNISPNAGGGS